MQTKTADRQEYGTFAGAFLASYLLLAAALANYLVYDRYPLVRTEVVAAFLVLALICAGVAWLYSRVGKWPQRLFDALLIALLADFFVDGALIPFAAAALYLIVSLWLNEAPHKLFAIFGGFVLLSSLLGLGESEPWLRESKGKQPPAAATRNGPAIVHVLLDEHVGIEGFHKTVSGLNTANALKSFYLDNGFTLYGKAYSQHMHTINAIPHILNFGTRPAEAATRRGAMIGRTAYFDRLREMGYRQIVYQSDFADFCSSYPDARCLTYANSSLQPLLDYDMTVGERTTLILAKFIGMSEGADFAGRQLPALDEIAARFGLRGFNGFVRLKETGTVPALRMFDTVARDLAAARPGEAYFFHALFPHYPYTATATCAPKPVSAWKRRKDLIPISDRANAYDEQARCASRQIGRLLAALEKSPAAGNFVMIVHGDHGSRLTSLDPTYERRGTYRKEDLIAGFSTLFAVRLPEARGSYVDKMVNVDRLLKDLANSEFRAAPAPLTLPQPYIFIDDRDWKPRAKEPMPTQW